MKKQSSKRSPKVTVTRKRPRQLDDHQMVKVVGGGSNYKVTQPGQPIYGN